MIDVKQIEISPREHLTEDTSPAPKRGRRGWLALSVCGLLLAGGGLYWEYGRDGAATVQSAAPPPPTVTVSAPLSRTIARSTEFTGQFSAIDQVDLRAQVSGYLTEIHFTDGQIVRKGDLLFVIDPRPYDIALQQAVAQYQTAVAAMDLANKQVVRTTNLTRDDFASRELLDQRVQAQQAAAAAIEQAKASIHAAQLNLDFTRITAPFSGRVSMRRVSLGSLVSGGIGATSSTVLTSIVSLDPIHLDFDMSEADTLAYKRFLASGQPGLDRVVQVSLDDETGWPRRGDLNFIDNAVDRSSGTLHARATVANPDLLITPGQFARLRLPVSGPRPVLMVPDAALVTDQSRKLLMVVAADGTVTPRPVEIGALDDNRLRVITSGLAPSDQVVISGLMRVRPGAKVTPLPGKIELASQN